MPRTEKQRVACKRNHLVMRLRGAWRLFFELDHDQGMNAVDDALVKLGAKSQTQYNEDFRKECLNGRYKW